MKDIQHPEGHRTGDINLAAALLSVGILPAPERAVTIIQPEDGRRYASFRLLPTSADGVENIAKLMAFWSGEGSLAASHGFPVICDFLAARPRNCRTSDDMLDFAFEWFAQRGHKVATVRGIDDIPAFVESMPDCPAAYVLAFIHNREHLFRVAKTAGTDYLFERGSGSERRVAIISSDLPKWQSRELTARLKG